MAQILISNSAVYSLYHFLSFPEHKTSIEIFTLKLFNRVNYSKNRLKRKEQQSLLTIHTQSVLLYWNQLINREKNDYISHNNSSDRSNRYWHL